MFVLPPLNSFDVGLAQEDIRLDGGSYVFRDEAILGTRMQINLLARNHSDALVAAMNARREIDRLADIFNSRAAHSELHLLNRSERHCASPELFAVIAAAERWRIESGGAFSGRLGTLIDAWRQTGDLPPSRSKLARMARAINEAQVHLDFSTLTIDRPSEVQFALDAIAKGWIVDRAFETALSSPGIAGALLEIGGDIRCGGRAPTGGGWSIGIPDANPSVDNAPIVAMAELSNQSIATSGRGPRDRLIGGIRYSPTLSPHDGWPIEQAISATALAQSAADADAIATALLAMPTERAIEWADRRGISARIVTHEGSRTTLAGETGASKLRRIAIKAQRDKSNGDATSRWPKDWAALITFTAPPRQLVRDQYFRSPYVAMWITDADNKPVRTLVLIGTHYDYQKDNYIWWSSNNDIAEKMIATRSMSTSGTGIYKLLWDGVDDKGQPVPAGTYVLHIESSRERGKHTHRSLPLDFSRGRPFSDEIPTTEEAGGVKINFYHP